MELLLGCECCGKEKPKRNVKRNRVSKKLTCTACHQKAYRVRRPEVHELAEKNYRLRHPERYKEICRDWRLRHLEQYKRIQKKARRKWRKRNPEKRNKHRRHYYHSVLSDPRNTRQAWQEWTLTDMDFITAFDRPSDRQLSAQIGRSIQAIQVMRCKLKKK